MGWGDGGEGRAVEKFRPLRAKIPFRPSPRLLHFFGAPSAIGLLVAAERTGAISQRGSYFTDTGHVCPRVRPLRGDPYRESSTNAITLAEMLQQGRTRGTDCGRGRIQNANEQTNLRPRPDRSLARSPDEIDI